MFDLYTISSRDLPDILDSDALDSMIKGLESSFKDCDNEDDKEDLKHDIRVLNDFKEEVGKYIENGDALVAERAFSEYVREWIPEITPALRDLPDFIASAIDWDQVTNDIKGDFSEFELSGVSYFGRC